MKNLPAPTAVDDLRTHRGEPPDARQRRSHQGVLGELTPDVAQIALRFGADDIDGTIVHETIYQAAGSTQPARRARRATMLVRLIREAGRIPVERDTSTTWSKSSRAPRCPRRAMKVRERKANKHLEVISMKGKSLRRRAGARAPMAAASRRRFVPERAPDLRSAGARRYARVDSRVERVVPAEVRAHARRERGRRRAHAGRRRGDDGRHPLRSRHRHRRPRPGALGVARLGAPARRARHSRARSLVAHQRRARATLARALAKREPRFFERVATPRRSAPAPGKTGALVIGDAALDARRHASRIGSILGEAWLEWTGPAVRLRGVGGARPTTVEPRTRRTSAATRSPKGLATRRCDRAPSTPHDRGPRRGLGARSYLTESIRYDFGDEERRGLERFCDEAATRGLLPPSFDVRFTDEPRGRDPRRRALDTLARSAPPTASDSRAPRRRASRTRPRSSSSASPPTTVRRRKHPQGVVTYIVDRNVNYTNVCTTSCRFCAFYRPVGHPEGYVLTRERARRRSCKKWSTPAACRSSCKAGSIPSSAQLVRRSVPLDEGRVQARAPRALARGDLAHLAARGLCRSTTVLARLHAAGLDSVPGGGAEILVDRVRRKIAKAKCTSESGSRSCASRITWACARAPR